MSCFNSSVVLTNHVVGGKSFFRLCPETVIFVFAFWIPYFTWIATRVYNLNYPPKNNIFNYSICTCDHEIINNDRKIVLGEQYQ